MTSATTQAPRAQRGASSSLPPRVVVVTRATEFDQLLRRHGTPQQAEFFLRTREQALTPIRDRHERLAAALQHVMSVVPASWRKTRVDRGDLDRFLFEPEDVVVALGQDGLVANLAKYLEGQPVVGLNPDRQLFEGVLVPHDPDDAEELLHAAAGDDAPCERRSMVAAQLDDGQELLALNEIFVGHRSHQSARYRIQFGEFEEQQSSSGLIVSSGTGATGWAKSIARSRATSLPLPAPCDRSLAFFVREAWPSVATGASCVEGILDGNDALEIVSRMDDGGSIFGDGIEADRVEFGWGRRVRIHLAQTVLHLVR